MKLDITKPYEEQREICEALTAESIENVKAAARAIYGEYWDMTIGVYFRLCDGDLQAVGITAETVAAHYWLDGLKAFNDELVKVLRRLTIPAALLRKHEKAAQEMCIKIDFRESVLVFVQRYFGLKSFRECENITLAEYLIARRADYNRTIMERRAEQLQMAEIKKRSRK